VDPVGDGVNPNETSRNDFGLVWEEEEAHVMVGSRVAKGIMHRQQGHALPSSYMLELSHETKALQYFLRFFPYELLPDWACEVTRLGRIKHNKTGDTSLSYDRECLPSMLSRVFRCFMFVLLYPGQSRKSFSQVINVDEDPLA